MRKRKSKISVLLASKLLDDVMNLSKRNSKEFL